MTHQEEGAVERQGGRGAEPFFHAARGKSGVGGKEGRQHVPRPMLGLLTLNDRFICAGEAKCASRGACLRRRAVSAGCPNQHANTPTALPNPGGLHPHRQPRCPSQTTPHLYNCTRARPMARNAVTMAASASHMPPGVCCTNASCHTMQAAQAAIQLRFVALTKRAWVEGEQHWGRMEQRLTRSADPAF